MFLESTFERFCGGLKGRSVELCGQVSYSARQSSGGGVWWRSEIVMMVVGAGRKMN